MREKKERRQEIEEEKANKSIDNQKKQLFFPSESSHFLFKEIIIIKYPILSRQEKNKMWNARNIFYVYRCSTVWSKNMIK